MKTWPNKRWIFSDSDTAVEKEITSHLDVSPITARLLLSRGVCDAESARLFLGPQLSQLHDPCTLPDIESAVDRIYDAATQGERIVIYGDYDVDGISATALLLQCLQLIGANCTYYLPDRFEEGYGLNADSVKRIAADGARLLVTVDCGISGHKEIALARELGLDVIVTDHHEPGRTVPDALCVINPKLPHSEYPFRELSGAGVAFKLCWAIGKRFSATERVTPEFRDFLVDAVALAALGTIADVVPLTGENRVFAHFGLGSLLGSRNPGLVALRRVAGIEGDKPLDTFDVAFKLAPRLNAAGRMGSANACVELLTTPSPDRAKELAEFLDRENRNRQAIQRTIFDEAQQSLAGVEPGKAMVLASEGWHPGVIGIVASKLVNEYARPVFMIALEGEMARGSGRSIPEFDIFGALTQCEDLLLLYGGHTQAAGLRMRREKVPQFRERFQELASAALGDQALVPRVEIDAEVMLPSLSKTLLREIELLKPYGEANSAPVFMSPGLRIGSQIKRMGRSGQHVSFWVRQGNTAVRAVAFGMGEYADLLEAITEPCSLVYEPRLTTWRGRENIELFVRDLKVDGRGC